MFKRFLLATVVAAASAGAASAAPLSGSFSFLGFGGSYVGPGGSSATAQTATGLDFGLYSSSTGNGYGTNGTALVGNATGSFAAYNGMSASIADIAISGNPAATGNTANPYASNPFISFGGGAINVNFSNAAVTRSSTNTSITVAGSATFTDGNPADTTTGMFSVAADSQGGDPTSINFTFSGNASSAVTSVPEPISLALLGTGLVGLSFVRGKRRVA